LLLTNESNKCYPTVVELNESRTTTCW